MQQPQNKLTEIAVFSLVALLVIAAVFLLYFGKVDFTGMLTMFGFAGGVLGVQGAFKAPSPAQSAQLQALFSQVMQALPGLFAQLQPPAVTIHNTIPATPPTAIGQAAPIVAAAQPVPVQLAPNPAYNAATQANAANWQVQNAPYPAGQQAFPDRFTASVPTV